jgi:putative ABC transport system substrate-binding protein
LGAKLIAPASRALLFGLSSLALLLCCGYATSQPGKTHRIGYLSGAAAPSDRADPLTDQLRRHGYVEGRNLTVERRFGAGSASLLGQHARELVALKVDLIVAVATPAAQAAQKATAAIPIVFAAVVDPVGAGLVSNLPRPGKNITGVSLISADLGAKRLELLQQLVPNMRHAAVLQNPTNASNALQVKEAEGAARQRGWKLHMLSVHSPQEFAAAFRSGAEARVDALVVLDDQLNFMNRERIVALAAQHRLPAIFGMKDYTDAGGLVAYGPGLPEQFQRAAAYVDRILNGAKPADLPVEQPTRLELTINLKTARGLGLSVPQTLLVRADHIVQ